MVRSQEAAPPESERSVLALLDMPGSNRSSTESLDELKSLASTAGTAPVAHLTARKKEPDHKTFFSKGKVEELGEVCAQHEASLVFVGHNLSGLQQRNLERALLGGSQEGPSVVDRTSLILEIFSQRAQTGEAKLQVELARLAYASQRLVRSWTHLERQRGGVGLRGGMGEKQIEVDRRMIRRRMDQIRANLSQVRKTRALHRRARRRIPLPPVALVGYTNAGKSTLFNRLTQAHVPAQDKLFATLDPKARSMDLPGARKAALSDTVGFLHDLPHGLVEAFKATLEEVSGARLLLHVVDGSSPAAAQQRADVEQVLEEIGARDIPTLVVLNKTDRLDSLPALENGEFAVSARTGEGIEALREAIATNLFGSKRTLSLLIPATDGAALARAYREGQVLDRSDTAHGVRLSVLMDSGYAARWDLFSESLNQAS